MARKYISIRSKEDIDVHKIGLHNIGNHYIDDEGRRFVTRFNLRSHKIDIVQIVLGKEEARLLKQKRIKQKTLYGNEEKNENTTEDEKGSLNFTPPKFVKELEIPVQENVDVELLEKEFPSMVDLLKERIVGVLNNLKTAKIFSEMKSKSGQDFMLDIMSVFDHNISEVLDGAKEKLVELVKYPRPPSAYLSSFTFKQKQILDTWDSAEIMELVKAVIVGEDFLIAVEATYKLLEQLEDAITPQTIEKTEGENQRRLSDAKTTCQFLSKEILKDAEKILGWWKVAGAID